MRVIVRIIDSLSEWSGQIVHWLGPALILVMTFEVIMRHIFDKPQIWAFEVPIMMGGTMFVLGWAYCTLHKAHTRVDVIYVRLSPRVRAIVDVLGDLLLFFPFVFLLAYSSILMTRRAWVLNEKMLETHWYPPALQYAQ